DAEIDTSLLHLDGAPVVIWQNILSEAWKQTKVDALIAAAQQRYPTYAPLIAAIAQYRATPAPSAPASLDQPARRPPGATGDGATVQRVNTGGGAYIKGNVNTGGGDFVGRDKKNITYTAFDQSGQTVFGPQTNIEGGVNTAGGIFNSGMMTTGGAPAQPALAANLRRLQHAIAQAGQAALIDEEYAIDVDAALQKAIRQADKATPDPQAIQAHLATARDKLASIPAAGGLVTAIDAISRLLTV
ncbi:MAG: hypothetical protein ACOYNY_46970, partial [Caldilineaceae bacterium]